ncbi:Uncharacterised protein [Enterobacter hormaechei]|nr:Uncharacterised protein [Enterobacter hormaechei]
MHGAFFLIFLSAGSSALSGSVPVKNARLALAAAPLFLVMAVDFTGRMMSFLADDVLVVCFIAVALPLIRQKE